MDTKTQIKAMKEKAERPFGLVSDIYDIVEMFAICTVCIMLLFIFVFRLTVVNGDSMNKTLTDGEYLIISDVGYKPERGDIVVAQNVSLTGTYCEPLVKRVIAVGGDTIKFDFSGIGQWKLFVNGEEVDQSYAYFDVFASTIRPTWDIPEVIPEGYVFLMGDNRNHSGDSRLEAVGLMDERCIIGHALMRVFPILKIGMLTNK